LALLESEPPSGERSRREIELWIGLGTAAMAARGWGTPEAEAAYSRARELCDQLGESPALFPAIWGLWLFYWGRGPLTTAQVLVQDLLGLARNQPGEGRLLQAHHAAWATAFSRGDLRSACTHADEGIRLYDQDRDATAAAMFGNHDAGVCARLFLARASALMGRTDAAGRASEDAVSLARTLKHPFSLALAHVFSSAVAHACRQTDRVRLHADAAAKIACDQDFRLLLAWASAFQGWAAVDTGDYDGLACIVNAIAGARATGSEQFLPHMAGLAADAYLRIGNTAGGLASIADGLQVADRTGERFWKPELLRLRGELQIARESHSSMTEVEQSFREAIELARSQGATLLALRAANSLGRVLSRASRGGEARSLILSISRDLDQRKGVDSDEANAFLGELVPH
jgi:predicted ATPase